MVRDYSKIQLDPAQIAAQGYKEYLGGRAAEWERRGSFQLALLRELGLPPGATLLDIGCGPIRAGVHFIDFLAPGHYTGVDFNPSFIEAARQIVAGGALAARTPRLEVLADFDFPRLGARYDWLLCFSVLNHCDARQRRDFFDRVPAVMDAGSRLVVTHAAWFDPAQLAGTPLRVERTIAGERELPEALALRHWGFGDVGDRLPIVLLRRD
jgi:SAM-dependent methyltransferase